MGQYIDKSNRRVRWALILANRCLPSLSSHHRIITHYVNRLTPHNKAGAIGRLFSLSFNNILYIFPKDCRLQTEILCTDINVQSVIAIAMCYIEYYNH